jgi:hypothetical protein
MYASTASGRVNYASRSQRLYINLDVHRDYSSPGCSGSTSTMPHIQVTQHVARLIVDSFAKRRTSECLGTSHDSSRGSSSTTSTTPRVRVPRHVAWLVASLVVDFFAYVVCPDASARRAARHAARRAARCRLLRLRRASRCLGTLHGSLRRSSSTTSPTSCFRVPRHAARLVVDFFSYAARPGASARRAARHVARRRLLRLRRTSGCLGTSRGSLPRSSSTTSPTPRVRVPRHVTRLVALFVIDYFASAARPSASARRAAHHAARHAARRRLLRHTRLVTRLIASLVIDYSASRRLIVDYFAYSTRPGASARRAARHVARCAARRRLVCLADEVISTSSAQSQVNQGHDIKDVTLEQEQLNIGPITRSRAKKLQQ